MIHFSASLACVFKFEGRLASMRRGLISSLTERMVKSSLYGRIAGGLVVVELRAYSDGIWLWKRFLYDGRWKTVAYY